MEELALQFLKPPLFREAYADGFGTIFTSVYLPARNQVRYLWRDASWMLEMDAFREQSTEVLFTLNMPSTRRFPADRSQSSS